MLETSKKYIVVMDNVLERGYDFEIVKRKGLGKFFWLGLFLICIGTSTLSAQEPFITTWKTDNPGATTEDNQILIPGWGSEYLIEWEEIGNPSNSGDTIGSWETIVTFPEAGEYRVSISGDFRRIEFFSNVANNPPTDPLKLLTIEQWGDIRWTSMEGAFSRCENLTYHANDIPDLSRVRTMAWMFDRCYAFNGYINDWDVSDIEDMNSLFRLAINFNQPLDNWNVSNVKSMRGVFRSTEKFNQPLNDWDVSNVETLRAMFLFAKSFNQPLDQWDVSNCEIFTAMFHGAGSFNQPLNNWDVSNGIRFSQMFRDASSFNQPLDNWDVFKGEIFSGMFHNAESFNQPLNNWDVSNAKSLEIMFIEAEQFNQPLDNWDVSGVEIFRRMFMDASSFNQSLGEWDISSAEAMDFMLARSAIDCENYDMTLEGWASNPGTPEGMELGPEGLKYWQGLEPRNFLIDSLDWTIEGDEFYDCHYDVCELPAPEVLSEGVPLLCPGDSVVLEASVTAVTYNWYLNGEQIEGESGRKLIVGETGEYSVEYWDEIGCESKLSEPYELEAFSHDSPPILLNGSDKQIRSVKGDCRGFVDHRAEVKSCRPKEAIKQNSGWFLDLGNTGEYEINSEMAHSDGSPRESLRIYEEVGPGIHRLRWVLEDDMGNTSEWVQLLHVVDKNPPVAVCMHGIASSLGTDGKVSLPAWVFDIGSWDDCSGNDELKFSYSSDVNDIIREWTCNDLGGSAEEFVEVELWVTNEYGHQSYCVTYLKLNDTRKVCPQSITQGHMLSGELRRPRGESVGGAEVNTEALEVNYHSAERTDERGAHSQMVPGGVSYELSASKDGEALPGLSTLDILKVQRHIVGVEKITCPYGLIAADVNGDGRIDVLDVRQMRDILLGRQYNFSTGNTWIMVSEVIPAPGGEVPEYRESHITGKVKSAVNSLDFTAVKLGDVNHSHFASSASYRGEATFELTYTDQIFRKGDLLQIPVKSGDAKSLSGIQTAMDFDSSELKFVGLSPGMVPLDARHYHVKKPGTGEILISWSRSGQLELEKREVLFELEFEATGEGRLSDALKLNKSALQESKAYTSDGSTPLSLIPEKSTKEKVSRHGFVPNPFSTHGALEFELEYSGVVEVEITDISGRRVLKVEEMHTSGLNRIPLHAEDLGGSGIYIYHLIAGENRLSGRVVLVE
jgi:hypothetical protein